MIIDSSATKYLKKDLLETLNNLKESALESRPVLIGNLKVHRTKSVKGGSYKIQCKEKSKKENKFLLHLSSLYPWEQTSFTVFPANNAGELCYKLIHLLGNLQEHLNKKDNESNILIYLFKIEDCIKDAQKHVYNHSKKTHKNLITYFEDISGVSCAENPKIQKEGLIFEDHSKEISSPCTHQKWPIFKAAYVLRNKYISHCALSSPFKTIWGHNGDKSHKSITMKNSLITWELTDNYKKEISCLISNYYELIDYLILPVSSFLLLNINSHAQECLLIKGHQLTEKSSQEKEYLQANYFYETFK